MLKIISNYNKQDIIYSYTVGQTFPDIKGKLISIEINGNELIKLLQEKEIPIFAIDTAYITWHTKHAGKILNLLKEIL